MKTLTILAAALTLTTGCFHAGTKSESLHSKERFHENGQLASREIWRDRQKGGGTALLTDPRASALSRHYVNQQALNGGSTLTVGQIESVTSTNAIEAIGNAGGKLLNTTVTGGN